MNLALIRLLQLSSPTLPVGAYTYSQGLEWAAESGALKGELDAREWISDLLRHSVASFEAPLVAALYRAWAAADVAEAARLNDEFLASRETSELRAETVQMGYSLVRLLDTLDAFNDMADPADGLARIDSPAYPTAWTAAASACAIPLDQALPAYLWCWLENQVMAAVKLVPLGQSAGQRLLARLGRDIPALAASALTLPEEQWSNFCPGFALASSHHETQYTRLFRS